VSDSLGIDWTSPPFDQFGGIHRLAAARSGHASEEHARHQLYVGRDRRTQANVLIKVTSKPGLVYEQNLVNEIATLSTINRELPRSSYFPVFVEDGRLRDGRVYLATSFFDEWPIATAIGVERMPRRTSTYLRTVVEVAKAVTDLHGLGIWHVDLNPMNILYRAQGGIPVIRIVDFESSYEVARHARGVFYSPPTTSGYTAPELSCRAPDARSDVFSIGAVLYTMLAGYHWLWSGDVGRHVAEDADVDPELKTILLAAADTQPDRRFPSVEELSASLAEYAESLSRRW
jgi:serine/threonine protein kinase